MYKTNYQKKNLTKHIFAITWTICTSSWNIRNSRLDKYIHTWTWRVLYYLRKCERMVLSERQITSKETHQTHQIRLLYLPCQHHHHPSTIYFHHPTPYPYPPFFHNFLFNSSRNVSWSFLTLLKFNFSSSKIYWVWLLGYISPTWAN